MHAQRRTKNVGNVPVPNYYPNPDPQYPMGADMGVQIPPNYNYAYNPQSMQAQGIPQQWQQPQRGYQQQAPLPHAPPTAGMQPFNPYDPMAAMAMQYGEHLAGQGKDIVQKKMETYVTFFARLKYYFAVDTAYVAKKLILLFFPFTHKDWAVHFNDNEPIAPRFEINAPDLYIPSMAFVTYILTTGYLLGLNNKFSPEQLGKQASSAFGWVSLEIMLVLFTHYLFGISSSSLKFLDMVAFCSYKFVCIIGMLLASLVLGTTGYTVVLIYSSVSLCFFLMRTMRVAMLTMSAQGNSGGSKRTFYIVLFVCVCQPLMMYWLTFYLIDMKADE